jgi:2-dehydropantoate 2-reductase
MASEKLQKVCIFGAGAVGGTLAARLAASPSLGDTKISVIARGAHLDAIRAGGLRLTQAGEATPIVARVPATADPAELGPQDLVISTLKGHQIPAAAAAFRPLLKEATRVLIIQNGVPFWYFHGDVAAELRDRRIPDLDPDEALWTALGPERVLGGVVYQPAEVVAPGEVLATGPGRLVIGEPSGAMTEDLEAAAALVEKSGWTVMRSPRIRDEIWRKLLGNAAFNPISALTRATLSEMVEDPRIVAIIKDLMNEAIAVASALGADPGSTAEERIAVTRGLGIVRSSMLQDVLAGRALELTPLVQAVSLLGEIVGRKTPTLDVIYALTRLLDERIRAR